MMLRALMTRPICLVSSRQSPDRTAVARLPDNSMYKLRSSSFFELIALTIAFVVRSTAFIA